ncbi:MAG: methionine biosynthesis protein MetW [Candidatus Aminicenantes bacterium]|jgi:O-antigen chain-terminating methyltransferase
MKRTIEKLTQQRKDKENEFTKKLNELRKKNQDLQKLQDTVKSLHAQSQLEGIPVQKKDSLETEKKRPFLSLSKIPKQKETLNIINKNILPFLSELSQTLEEDLKQTREILSLFTEVMEKNTALVDAKDREWDALGSNHVGKIFKSMEWRVDKLTAGYEDANLLMKKFIQLREKMNELLSTLEEKKMPSPRLVKDVLVPLEDWRYAGFENRYRGSEEEVKKQQECYLSYFKQDKKVLDLGCGRGEFLALLKENDIQAEGIDSNEQMIDICRDRGLNCTKADILDGLTETEDNSLGGIFSSQVIEHMPPDYLKRVVELAYNKLAPSSNIVFETVNPTSVFALVQIYYLDLSHQKPIHPQALKFLLENAGFEEVEIKFSSELQLEKLQELPQADEASSILNRNVDKLNKLLYSPPNYAAIGKKT